MIENPAPDVIRIADGNKLINVSRRKSFDEWCGVK
jgi:hypothetical protein